MRSVLAYVKAIASSFVLIMQIPAVPVCCSHLYFLIAYSLTHCHLMLLLLWNIIELTEGQISVSLRSPSLLHEMFCCYMFTVCHVQCGNKLILNLNFEFEFEYSTWTMTHSLHNRSILQIPQCISSISHNATFCSRNVHMCAL